jgi:acetyl-CoA carboxylase biotin carboxyl carrier protein
MNEERIRRLIKLVEESEIAELEIRSGDTEIRIRKFGQAPPEQAAIPSAPLPVPVTPPAPLEPQPEVHGDLHTITSPMVGTFYRAPAPDAEPFVEVGGAVQVGHPLCIIEAMKLMNEIDADRDGEIVTIFVEDGQPVQYGEPLFAVRPA